MAAALQGSTRRHVDDLARTLLQHVGHDGPAEDKGRAGVQVQHEVPGLQRGLVDRRAGPVAAHGVGQHVDAAKALQCGLHRTFDRFGVGRIHRAEQQVVRRAGQLREKRGSRSGARSSSTRLAPAA